MRSEGDANFQPKFPNFRYHGNRGRSEKNFDDTVKLHDPKNHHFGANVLLLSLKMPELVPFEAAIGRNASFQIWGEKRG